jgi:aminoglycoside phosphotransferase (APT) family kinase protein
LREAEAMTFVSQRTNIRVPRVFDVWVNPDDQEQAYLIMEYLEGENLDVAWPKMDEPQ